MRTLSLRATMSAIRNALSETPAAASVWLSRLARNGASSTAMLT